MNHIVTPSTIDDLAIQRIRVDKAVPGVTALTSLLASEQDQILVGATSHTSSGPVLVAFNPRTLELQDTGFRFPAKGSPGSYGQSVGDKIHDALIHGKRQWDDWCLLGHGSHIWWDDGGWPFDPTLFAGGAVYAWHPQRELVQSLGIPVPRNTVHGLYGGDGFAVGYSLPDNHFFALDYASGEMCDFGRLSAYCCHSFACQGQRAVGVYRRSVGEQRGDLVVSADHAAFLFIYDHAQRQLQRTDLLISELETNIRFNSGIDCMVSTEFGVIGGRVNGTLFKLDIDQQCIEELGYAVEPTDPPLNGAQVRQFGGSQCRRIRGCERITAMTMLDDHRLVGTAGFPQMHLFVMDVRTGERQDLGPVNTQAPMCYFHDLVVVRDDDGKRAVVLAETDSEHADLYVVRDPSGQYFN